MGRSTKLDEATSKRICEAIETGNYASVAAHLAGIGETTLYRWLERGKKEADDEDSIYREFRESLKRAEAEAEMKAVAVIVDAMPQSWQAAMTFLERKFPSRWARGKRVEHSGEGRVVVEIRGADLIPDRADS